MPGMGIVISLADHRPERRGSAGGARPRVTFAFDLASPWTYLAAERVDRLFVGVNWRPAYADVLPDPLAVADPSGPAGRDAAERAAAERRAGELRLPLVWPDRAPDGRQAMRVAALAAEQDRAAPFVLAAGRLAFCGGYDLDDPETIAEAAAAAGLGLDDTLRGRRRPRSRRRARGGRPAPAGPGGRRAAGADRGAHALRRRAPRRRGRRGGRSPPRPAARPWR